MQETELLQFLTHAGISYQRYAHPAVLTSAEAAACLEDAPGVEGKNLFLQDKKGSRYLLLMTLESKRVDLKAWARSQGLGKLSFAEVEMLSTLLKVGRGAVGPLALIHDEQQRIAVFVDRQLWQQGVVRCHPLVNTASLILTLESLQHFLELTGHTLHIVDVPAA